MVCWTLTMAAEESPFAQVPEPGIHEGPSMLTQPHADIAAARVAARSIRRFPLVIRVAFVAVAILFVVGLPLGLIIWGN